MNSLKLYMVLLGCKPPGRNTEQHDVFFGIGKSLSSLIPEMQTFWPEAEGRLHIDAWREVSLVDGYKIEATPKENIAGKDAELNLFFINLGGYKPGEFEEYHYKLLCTAKNSAEAAKNSTQTAFYRHTGFGGGARSHIDDKYGVDVDEIYNIRDILSAATKEQYTLRITAADMGVGDDLHIGYLSLKKLLARNE